MRRLILILVSCFGLVTNSQIVDAEYFIDTDPGVGNGTAITMSGDVIDLDFNVPTSSLTEGIHKLYVRVLNADGWWSLYDKQVFYVNPTQDNLTNISAAEYFFDTDPGVGNGMALIGTGDTIDEIYNISTIGLSEGIHKLSVRVMNSEGAWSLYDQNLFYINPSQVNSSNIVSVEYFIDTDPGQGNGTALSLVGEDVIQDFSITNSLSDGIHKIYVRVLNNDGQWGLYDKKLVHVHQNNVSLITAAEYFFDIDPGFGNATSLDYNDLENLDQDFTIQVPNDLPEGDHYLYLRVLNTDGVWSLYSTSEMLSSLSVEDQLTRAISFYPNPVKDILYLETQNQDINDFKIIDLTGKVVLEGLPKNSKIDMSHLNSGTYLLYLKTSTGSVSKKIIKQ